MLLANGNESISYYMYLRLWDYQLATHDIFVLGPNPWIKGKYGFYSGILLSNLHRCQTSKGMTAENKFAKVHLGCC